MIQKTIHKNPDPTSPDPVTYYLDNLRETRKTWTPWRTKNQSNFLTQNTLLTD